MIRNYLKIAWRNLSRHKSYAIINIIGLSLGIACGILIFTMVNYHLSFEKFNSHGDRTYRLVSEFHSDGIGYSQGIPSPLGKAFRTDLTYAEKTARVVFYNDQLVTINDKNEIKKFKEEDGMAYAEPDYFDILDFSMERGDKNTVLANPNSAVVTQKLVHKYFGNEDPIGKSIKIDNRFDFTITGIMKDVPKNTDRRQEIYVSYESFKDRNPRLARDSNWNSVYSGMQAFVLLKPGVDPKQVERSLVDLSKKYYNAEDAKVYRFKMQPLFDIHFDSNYDGYADKKYLWALAFVGLFLIITACVNFINLATAQALNRAKEVGVRKVMGSLRSQLFWQFIMETALITVFATLLAFGIAELVLPLLNNLFKTEMTINLLKNIQLLPFLLLLVVLVVFLSGSYPGLILARFQPALALKSKLSQKHIGKFSLRRILVVTQFAISQMLIIGTIVIASQMNYSKNTDLGFSKDAVVMLPVPNNDRAKMSTLHNRVGELSGVANSSFCFQAPASNSNMNTDITFDNRPKEELFSINAKAGDDKYVSTFSLKVIAGRNIYPADTVREFVVNEKLIEKLRLRSADEAIGKKIAVNGGQNQGLIVGVVKDFYQSSFRDEIEPICIMTYPRSYSNLAVKLDGGQVKSTLASLEKIWSDTYPDYVYSYKFLDDRIAEFYELDNIMLKLIEGFAGIAIFIGCLGLYGLVSFMAVRKTKEIGVRKVLGASVQNILWLFGREFTRLLIIAFLIAAPLAWWAMHVYLQDFKYRIQIGAGIFILSILSTFIVATVTVGYRSIKSALANPVKSLRTE